MGKETGNSKLLVIAENIKKCSEAPIAEDIFYRCLSCGGVIPSRPSASIGCDCDNLYIDVAYHRLDIEDFSKFQVVQEIVSD